MQIQKNIIINHYLSDSKQREDYIV